MYCRYQEVCLTDTISFHITVEHKVLYFFGAVGLTVVNSVALATELMMKAREYESQPYSSFV